MKRNVWPGSWRLSVAFLLSTCCVQGGDATFEQGALEAQRGAYGAAVRIWQTLASGGNTRSQCALAGLYAEGKGVPQSHEQALAMYQQAAEAGDPCAYAPLADIYYRGHGVDPDRARGDQWLEMSAKAGDPESQWKLGMLFRYTSTVFGRAQDCQRATGWIEASATQGHADAQASLATIYAEGQCVEADDREAARWARKAAEQDHGQGQLLLAALYRLGRGVSKDPVKAYMWERIALPGSDVQSLPPAERLRAERLALEWRKARDRATSRPPGK